MPDGASSSHPGVQAQLDRLNALSPGRDILGLDRIRLLLKRLGNPHGNLPPVFHVAGTNGKGSTCAFLRAAIEASGKTCHVYTSPHLVRFNERIRIAGKLVGDDHLAALLDEVLDVAEGSRASFFEVTTAAALLAFSRSPADACILETGLGGRLDATNIIPAPTICGIASLGIDHEAFLLAPEDDVPTRPLNRIAFEKAGIGKRGKPMVIQRYAASITETIRTVATQQEFPVLVRGEHWDAATYKSKLHYRDAAGKLTLPLPRLAGVHQADNAALAIAMLRHQTAVDVNDIALKAAMGWVEWPARLQRLPHGPLVDAGREIWLDGGHNVDAGLRLGQFFGDHDKLHLIIGMLSNKNPAAIIAPLLARLASITVVPVPSHDAHPLGSFAGLAGDVPIIACPDIATALTQRRAGATLIAGSLYLAGEVLRTNGQMPD